MLFRSNAVAGATLNGGLSNAATVAVTANTFFINAVTNTGAFFMQGAISNTLVNSGSFTLNNNTTLTAAPVNTGTINAGANTLTVTPAWANAGTVTVTGGTIAGGNLTNNNTIAGNGTVSPLLVNNGQLIATNGTLTLATAPVNNGSITVPGTLSVTPAWANGGGVNVVAGGSVSGGNLTNTASGSLTNFGAINTLVVNQGRSVLGGLVQNFQQTAGTNTVSGSGSVKIGRAHV